MKALAYDGRQLALVDRSVPETAEECLVRVVKSGICNTDLEIVKGYAKFSGTIGHEFVGIVECSPDRPDLSGRRVVGAINVGCGMCQLCRGGDERHCPSRTVLGIKGRDGAHAEFLSLPARNLFEVPSNVSDDEAVFAEPLAAAFAITEQVTIEKDTSVAVVGDGKLGLLSVRLLAGLTGRLALIGKHREKLKRAEATGAEIFMAADCSKMASRFDIVMEASGSEAGFATALDLVKPRGKIVLKSTFYGSAAWEPSRVVVNEVTVSGSRCGRIGPALELLSSGKVGVADLISDQFSLRDGIRALETAASSGVLKILLNND